MVKDDRDTSNASTIPTPEYLLTGEQIMRKFRGVLLDGERSKLLAEYLRSAYDSGWLDSKRATGSAQPGDPQRFVDELIAAIFGAKVEQAEYHSVSDALREAERLHAFKRGWRSELRADLVRRANELPGLSAAYDEMHGFAALVRECLAEHDAASGALGLGVAPDNAVTTKIRAALLTLPPPFPESRKPRASAATPVLPAPTDEERARHVFGMLGLPVWQEGSHVEWLAKEFAQHREAALNKRPAWTNWHEPLPSGWDVVEKDSGTAYCVEGPWCNTKHEAREAFAALVAEAPAKLARIRQIINWTPITSDHRERQVLEIIAVLDGSSPCAGPVDCTECPSAGLTAHVLTGDVTKSCPIYVAYRNWVSPKASVAPDEQRVDWVLSRAGLTRDDMIQMFAAVREDERRRLAAMKASDRDPPFLVGYEAGYDDGTERNYGPTVAHEKYLRDWAEAAAEKTSPKAEPSSGADRESNQTLATTAKLDVLVIYDPMAAASEFVNNEWAFPTEALAYVLLERDDRIRRETIEACVAWVDDAEGHGCADALAVHMAGQFTRKAGDT